MYGPLFLAKHGLQSVVDFHGNTKWAVDRTASNNDSASLVLLVQTSPSRIEHRRIWRKRKASFDKAGVRVVFCIGRDGTVQDVDVLRERSVHGDIVLLDDILEDYYKLTEKTLSSFRWADEHLSGSVQYVGKVDDDMYVDPFRLIDVLRHGARRENYGENNGEGEESGGGWITYPNRGLCVV